MLDSCETRYKKNIDIHCRIPYYIVPVPGETPWARSMTTADSQFQFAPQTSTKSSRKRGMEEGSDLSQSTGTLQQTKRHETSTESTQPSQQNNEGNSAAAASSNFTSNHGQNDAATSETDALKNYFPFPDETEVPCLARFYSDEVSGLKVGDTIEVIGVLSVDPELTGEASMIGSANPQAGDTADDVDMRFAMANDKETMAKNPPASLVPRVQCVLWRHLAPTFPKLQPPLAHSKGTFVLNSGQERTPSSRGAEADKERKRAEVQLSVENQSVLSAVGQMSLRELTESTGCSVAELRNQAVQCLAALVGNDSLAAEYILFNIISRITSRTDTLVLGKAALNISGAPDESSDTPETIERAQEEQRRVREWQERQRHRNNAENTGLHEATHQTGQSQANGQPNQASGQQRTEVIPPAPADPTLPLIQGASTTGKRLAQCIGSFVPRSVILPMRLNNLNGLRFAPKKSYETNRLNAGVLQLPTGTHLLVDETVMHTGKLDETGVKNIQSLANVMNTATLKYDFEYHAADFPVDIPVMSLTAGRSLLPVDIRVHLSDTAQNNLKNNTVQVPSFGEQQLDALRKYFATVRMLSNNMTQETTKQIEEDMVGARQQNGESISQEYMHLWLSLAKLNAISHGEESLSVDRWRQTGELEKQRLARLPEESERPPAQPATIPPSPTSVRDA